MNTLRRSILTVFVITMTGLGQIAWAGPVSTDFVVDADAKSATIERLETLLATERVAQELATHGVEQALIGERLNAMTSAELQQLEGQLSNLPAGEGVLGLVGAVFVVLLILEIVGVTDIFTAV